ncbi:MAG TPA: DUF4440 domain-containing protein [Gemmatimonadota bacterium]|nr:DUF4440 domain-containing protein [Gemmatimonadota bacterium]
MSYLLRSALAVAAIAFLTAACQTQEADQVGTTEDAITDTETVRQSIESSNDAFEQAILAGNGTALADFYTADAIVLGPFMPRAQGTEAIGSFWTEMMSEGPPSQIALTTDELTVSESGELAYEIGSFDVAGTTPEGTAWEEEGKYLVVWENVDGEWKMAADAWNSDAAPPGMEHETPAEGETPAESGAPATEDTE